MIEAQTRHRAGFAARLTNVAGKLAKAHGESLLRRRRADGSHWRNSQLLWPRFNQDL